MDLIDKIPGNSDRRVKIVTLSLLSLLVIVGAYFAITYSPTSPGVVPIKDDEMFSGIPISGVGDTNAKHRDPKSLSVIIRYAGSWEAEIGKYDMPGDVNKAYDTYTGHGPSEIFITGSPGLLSVRVWKKEDDAKKMTVNICRGDPMYDNAKTAFLDSGSVIEANGKVDLSVSFHKDGSITAS